MLTTQCPKCKKALAILSPLSSWTRFFRCVVCAVVFWWDGPSILGEKDKSRKTSFSDKLFELTDAQVIALKGI